jgi:hypothetical protein
MHTMGTSLGMPPTIHAPSQCLGQKWWLGNTTRNRNPSQPMRWDETTFTHEAQFSCFRERGERGGGGVGRVFFGNLTFSNVLHMVSSCSQQVPTLLFIIFLISSSSSLYQHSLSHMLCPKSSSCKDYNMSSLEVVRVCSPHAHLGHVGRFYSRSLPKWGFSFGWWTIQKRSI